MGSAPLGRRQFLELTGLLGAAAAGVAACSSPSAPPPSTTAGSPTAGSPAAGSPAPSPASTGSPAPVPAVLGRNSEGDLLHGPRTGTALALTFHGAGDPALATRVFAELRAAGALVTVFAVGSWLQANPSMASAVLDAGHDLGNHTYHHLAMSTLGAAAADEEVARCASVLKHLTGTVGSWFRPSGTATSNATIRSAAHRGGYAQCVSYDVDSLDWTDPGPAAVTSRVLALSRPGSIVSLHLGHAGTVTALPAVLAGLHARGLRPVTLTELTT